MKTREEIQSQIDRLKINCKHHEKIRDDADHKDDGHFYAHYSVDIAINLAVAKALEWVLNSETVKQETKLASRG